MSDCERFNPQKTFNPLAKKVAAHEQNPRCLDCIISYLNVVDWEVEPQEVEQLKDLLLKSRSHMDEQFDAPDYREERMGELWKLSKIVGKEVIAKLKFER